MHRATVFRVLLLLFVSCYVAALYAPGFVDLSRSPELRAYLEEIDVLYGGYRFDMMWFAMAWLLGHLVEVVGLVLLFCRVRMGLWPACAGAAFSAGISWFVTQREHGPILETTIEHLLWSATCVLWGSYVCMALTDRRNVFAPVAKSGPPSLD